jgi:hypothetical protein
MHFWGSVVRPSGSAIRRSRFWFTLRSSFGNRFLASSHFHSGILDRGHAPNSLDFVRRSIRMCQTYSSGESPNVTGSTGNSLGPGPPNLIPANSRSPIAPLPRAPIPSMIAPITASARSGDSRRTLNQPATRSPLTSSRPVPDEPFYPRYQPSRKARSSTLVVVSVLSVSLMNAPLT